jgi:hypothetical protein
MNIFISYNRRNESIVKSLVEDLKTLGHSVWFDQELSGGQVWWDRILATIRGCDVFVFVLAQEPLNSTACMREYGYALDLGKPILPVLVAEGVSINLLPPGLSQIQFVDYRKQDRNAAFRLARALTTVPPPEPLPEPLPPPPESPISYLASLTEKIETASTLNYEKQSALLLDLKRSLRKPETADDAQVLLERLRKRHDLLASIAEEIDELLMGTRESATLSAHSPEPELPPQKTARPPKKPHGKTETSEPETSTPQEAEEAIDKAFQQENKTEQFNANISYVSDPSGITSREKQEPMTKLGHLGFLSIAYLFSIMLGVICILQLVFWKQDWNMWLGLLIPLIIWGVSGLLFARHSRLLAIVIACVCFVIGIIIFLVAPG